MTWEEFASKVRTFQKGFMGEPKEIRPGRGEFHENPTSCICENAEAKTVADSDFHSQTKVGSQSINDNLGVHLGEPTYYKYTDEDLDWRDLDYGEVAPLGKTPFNATNLDYDLFLRTEDPLLEEIISD